MLIDMLVGKKIVDNFEDVGGRKDSWVCEWVYLVLIYFYFCREVV